MKIALLTRTNWHESPRIRHQIARLLRDNGHDVFFFEKGTSSKEIKTRTEENITFINSHAPIHHQLKPFKMLQNYYAKAVKASFTKALIGQDIDVVINFNYDYGFARSLFPKARYITFINDNFIDQAKGYMRKAIESQLAETCKISDHILAVSYPLVEQVKRFNSSSSSLFLPWSDTGYQKEVSSNVPDTVLYYGYINRRIDWGLARGLLEADVKMRFVGPIQDKETQQRLDQLSALGMLEILPPAKMDELDLKDILCSTTLYDSSISSIQAVTLSNRAMQLLSYGIPVIYPKLPHLIKTERSIISTADNVSEIKELMHFYENHQEQVQQDIKDFVKERGASQAYETLMGHLKP